MTKLETKDTNYAATIVRVSSVHQLEGLDNLVALPFFGFQALVPKTTQPGELGVLFTAETQLSDDFCSKNNLYRHSEKNENKEAKGYLEDNRRVRAIRLRGHTSSALFLPLSSLTYLGDVTLSEGDTFTHIDGVEVCCKYRVHRQGGGVRGFKERRESKIIDKLFPKHFDTEHFFRNSHKIPEGSVCIVTQKIHGTSARFAHQVVKRDLSWFEKMVKWLGVKVPETEYAFFCGTRNTAKDPEDLNDANGYYKENLWAYWLDQIKHKIPKNWVIYGEIFGYTPNGSPIQKGYTYWHDVGQSSFAVYRVSVVNEDGVAVDLHWDAVKRWCESVGLAHVPELFRMSSSGIEDAVMGHMDTVLSDFYPNCARLSKESPCDEGVCVRVDIGPVPFILKAKSPQFLEHETKCIDKGEVDVEEEANAV